MDSTSSGDHTSCNCDKRRIGNINMPDDSDKVNILQERVALLTRTLEGLEGYVDKLSLTRWMLAISLLRDEGHAEVAGLAYHFMVNAMNMSTGGD